MKLTLGLILFFASAITLAAEPEVAMMSCSGVTERGNPQSATSFRVVMEQTNSDVQDGSVLLDESRYDKIIDSSIKPMEFRIRIFKNVDPYLIEGEDNHMVQADHLLNSTDIPSNAYEEITEGTNGGISFMSFRVHWGFDDATGLYDYDINYKPSNKAEEGLGAPTSSQTRDVYCHAPFMKSQIPQQQIVDPNAQAQDGSGGTGNAEVQCGNPPCG